MTRWVRHFHIPTFQFWLRDISKFCISEKHFTLNLKSSLLYHCFYCTWLTRGICKSNLRAGTYGPWIRCRFCGSWDFLNLCKPLSSIKFYLGSTKMNFPSSISRFFRIFVRLSLHKHDWHTDLSHVFIFQKMFIVFIWWLYKLQTCSLLVPKYPSVPF